MMARETDGVLVLRDPIRQSEHRLNAVAAYIWRRCDGRRDARSIAADVAAHYRRPLTDVSADVARVLATFASAGIVRRASGPRREIDLLLHCVRLAVGTDRPGESPLPGGVGGTIDWNDILQTAYEHGVLPLLHCGLSHEDLPPVVLERLQSTVDTIRTHNRRLLEELALVLDEMERKGIGALSLKGPIFARIAYGDVRLRSFADLDVFVRPFQAQEAIEILRGRGYRLRPGTNHDGHVELWRPADGVHVDLQWTLAPRRFRSLPRLDDLWSRLERVHVGEMVVWQPPPCDQLTFLCGHGAKHCWSRLQWIADVAAYVRRVDDRVDWCDVLAQAVRAGGARQLLLGMHLAGELLGASVPAVLARAVCDDHAVAPLARELRDRLFDSVEAPQRFQGSYGPYRGGFLYVRTRERLRDRVPYLAHLALRPVQRLRAKAIAAAYHAVHARWMRAAEQARRISVPPV